MCFIIVRPRKGVSSYSYILTSDFRLANNRELNTTLVEAINQFCFGEGSSWRIYTTPVSEKSKRKNISGTVIEGHFFVNLEMCFLDEETKSHLVQEESG